MLHVAQNLNRIWWNVLGVNDVSKNPIIKTRNIIPTYHSQIRHPRSKFMTGHLNGRSKGELVTMCPENRVLIPRTFDDGG